MTETLHFPGSTAVSDLAVYDWQTPDGLHGGSPHLHTVSTEGYVVLEGTGELRTLTPAGSSSVELRQGVVLWFAPGTIHRLVNAGGLRILTVMQNAGLPEAGDAVLTFPSAIVADPERYRLAAALPDPDSGEDETAEAARRRRDLALDGFASLEADFARRGPSALEEFYDLAVKIVAPRVADWRQLWSASVERDARTTREQLAALAEGSSRHLRDARIVVAERAPGPPRFGMCGRLGVWPQPA